VQLVNRAFLSAGFVNSGLIVRPSPTPGVLAVHIVYGGLAPPGPGEPPVSVSWTGGRRKGLTASYVRERLPSTGARPLSVVALERDFRLLAEDPAVRTVNADLRPGARAGDASLALSVYPADRFDLYVTAANNRAPSVGGERVAVGGSVRNALRAGDLLSAEAGRTRGVDDATVSYAVPLFAPQNALFVRANYDNAAIVDTLLSPLDIRAKERSVEAGVTRKVLDAPLLPGAQPGRWSPARTLTAGATVSWREQKSFLLGERFSFAPGAVNGRSQYTALRLTGDYVSRNVDQVFAASLTATFGLDGTKSDVPGLPNPKPHFHAVLAQLNYARRLTGQGLELRARLSGQWADGLLYSGERFSAGGESTVRGYRENLLLADRGAAASIELAQPIWLSSRRPGARAFDWDSFAVSVFADGALMRNDRAPQPEHAISSVGASVLWTPSEAISARATYAHALRPVDTPGERDLQDRGYTFRVTVRPLKLRR
jgi:hemolysin activation/secretion protein